MACIGILTCLFSAKSHNFSTFIAGIFFQRLGEALNDVTTEAPMLVDVKAVAHADCRPDAAVEMWHVGVVEQAVTHADHRLAAVVAAQPAEVARADHQRDAAVAAQPAGLWCRLRHMWIIGQLQQLRYSLWELRCRL